MPPYHACLKPLPCLRWQASLRKWFGRVPLPWWRTEPRHFPASFGEAWFWSFLPLRHCSFLPPADVVPLPPGQRFPSPPVKSEQPLLWLFAGFSLFLFRCLWWILWHAALGSPPLPYSARFLPFPSGQGVWYFPNPQSHLQNAGLPLPCDSSQKQ